MRYDKNDRSQRGVPAEFLVPGWWDNLVLLLAGALVITLVQVC